MYITLVRSGMEDASIIWDPHSKCDAEKLEKSSTFCSQMDPFLVRYSWKTNVTSLLQRLPLEPLEQRRRVQWLVFMYKILNDQVAVPAALVHLILSSRPLRGVNANRQKLVNVRSFTENYRQSYSIRTVRDRNALPQSVISAGSSAQFMSQLTRHISP